MVALKSLDSAFALPDAVHNLRKNLRQWREEVNILFPNRSGKPSSRLPDEDTLQKGDVDSKRLIRRTRHHLGVRFASVSGKLVERRTWNSLSKACTALHGSLQEFFSAMNYLSDSQETWCTIAIGELILTLTVRSRLSVFAMAITDVLGCRKWALHCTQSLKVLPFNFQAFGV